jgi:hypothetical protein
MKLSKRKQFLSYVRGETKQSIVSPFLPDPGVIKNTLSFLGLEYGDDSLKNEIRLSEELDYEPMFMTAFSSLIFPWKEEKEKSDEFYRFCTIKTSHGEWQHKFPKDDIPWSDTADCPINSEKDHEKIVLICEQISERETEIRNYFRNFRDRVGENGVIVAGHPHPSWLGYQISPQAIYYQWNDFPSTYKKSMDVFFEASKFVMSIAIDEGIDFMSDSSYGLEMTSPKLFNEMDLPYIQGFSKFTHEYGGLFWYHNCGFTSGLIRDGSFNLMGADVIETIAPPPEGDNDLAESRQFVDAKICTKGNLNLDLLRDGTPEKIRSATEKMVAAVDGWKHILSTADAVLPGTSPENFIAFVKTAREY